VHGSCVERLKQPPPAAAARSVAAAPPPCSSLRPPPSTLTRLLCLPFRASQYMVAMGIKGSGNEGLKSQAWTDQTPSAGWEGFFAGASNIIFTFGQLTL